MLRNYGHTFYRLGEQLEFILGLAEIEPGEGESDSDLVGEHVYSGLKENLEQALPLCKDVNLEYTAVLLKRLLALPREVITYGWLKRESPPLQDRMADETAATKFLHVSASHVCSPAVSPRTRKPELLGLELTTPSQLLIALVCEAKLPVHKKRVVG